MDELFNAEAGGGPQNFKALVDDVLEIINLIIPIVAGLAVLIFFWGLVKFIVNVSGDEKAVTEGKNLMIWGIIALFVMVSLGGILYFFSGEVGFKYGLPLLPV